MKLDPLVEATFLKRYKRFIAEFRSSSGEILQAHCPNSGSMKGCLFAGNPACLSYHPTASRKYAYTWEMIFNGQIWIGINTLRTNQIVEEGLQNGLLKEFLHYPVILKEKKYGMNSRIDFLLTNAEEMCFIEVKNVTLVENGRALFPDAVTLRGQKHLQELTNMVHAGHRAVIFFLVQRQDAEIFSPADDIDPVYGELLRKAEKAGVEIIAYRCRVSPKEIGIDKKIPYEL